MESIVAQVVLPLLAAVSLLVIFSALYGMNAETEQVQYIQNKDTESEIWNEV